MQKQSQEKSSVETATSDSKNAMTLSDNREQTSSQQALKDLASNSPQTLQQKAIATRFTQSPQITAQRKQQDTFKQNQPPLQRKANNTGLPDNLKSGIESLSGISMDSVKVHYNSAKPAQMNAHAYAQGTDIHVAAGQEKHLPHEAWHVVQQAQGRVRPNTDVGGTPVNDDPSLESEATRMGDTALQRAAISDNPPAMTSGIFQAVAQREPDAQTEEELSAIIAELEALKNEAEGLGGDDDPAPGIRALAEKIDSLKKIASDTDTQKKSAALEKLKAEIPGGDVDALKEKAPEPTSTESTTDTDTTSQLASNQTVQRLTGIEIGLLVGGIVVGIGLIAGGIAAYIRKRKNQAIFNEFGNAHRNKDFNPDVVGEDQGGIHQVDQDGARPEDAPLVNAYRINFHKLHSAKLYMEHKHPQLLAGFELANAAALNNLTLRDRMLQIASGVKDESKNHKKRVKDLSTNTTIQALNAQYQQNVTALGNDALAIANLIETYINNHSTDQNDLEGIHTEGTDIWRETWHRAIMAVNTVLHGRWPHWQGQIRQWIQNKRDEDDTLTYMDPRQVLGLDYIGSLAKGYKGPPKQSIRFTPEKFDVDANLTAPPLAAYALTVGGAIVDRGRIWSHKAGPALFNGLLKPMQDDIQLHLVNAGLIQMGMDPNEPFEAVIDAEGVEGLANVPAAAVAKKALSERDLAIRNKLFSLRHTDPGRFQRVGAALQAAGYSHNDHASEFLNEHDENNQTYAFDNNTLGLIDGIIDNTL